MANSFMFTLATKESMIIVIFPLVIIFLLTFVAFSVTRLHLREIGLVAFYTGFVFDYFNDFSPTLLSMRQLSCWWMSHLFLPPTIFYASYRLDWSNVADKTYGLFVIVLTELVVTTSLGYIGVRYIFLKDDAMAFAMAFLFNAQGHLAPEILLAHLGIPREIITYLESESLFKSGIIYSIYFKSFAYNFDPDVIFFEFVTKTVLLTTTITYVVAQLAEIWVRSSLNHQYLAVVSLIGIINAQFYFFHNFFLNDGYLAVVLLGYLLNSNKESNSLYLSDWQLEKTIMIICKLNVCVGYFILGMKASAPMLENISLEYIIRVIIYFIAFYFLRFISVSIAFCIHNPYRWERKYAFIHMAAYFLVTSNMITSLCYLPPLDIHARYEREFFLYVIGVAKTSLWASPSVIRFLMPLLQITALSPIQRDSMKTTLQKMKKVSHKSIMIQKRDPNLVNALWDRVRKKTNIDKLTHFCKLEISASIERRIALCPSCGVNIEIEAGPNELQEMQQATNFRLIKSFIMAVTMQKERKLISRKSYAILMLLLKRGVENKQYISASSLSPFIKPQTVLYKLKCFFKRCHMLFSQKMTGGLFIETLPVDESKTLAKLANLVMKSTNFKIFSMANNILSTTYCLKKTIKRIYSIFDMYYHPVFLVGLIIEVGINIVSMGYKRFWAYKWNRIDAFIIVFQAYFLSNIPRFQLYITILYAMRNIRLFSIVTGYILNKLQSRLNYDVFVKCNLGLAFAIAEEEILKHRELISSCKPIMEDIYLATTRNRLYLMKILSDLRSGSLELFAISKTRIATLYILHDIRTFLDEAEKRALFEEPSILVLKTKLDEWTKGMFSESAYQIEPASNIFEIITRIQWINNQPKLRNAVLKWSTLVFYHRGDVIQHPDVRTEKVRIITSGIARVEGKVVRYSTGSMVNADSYKFFEDRQFCLDYVSVTHALGLVGYLSRMTCYTKTTAETDVQCIEVSYSLLNKVAESIRKPPFLQYALWRHVALRTAIRFLAVQKHYQDWGMSKIKMHVNKAHVPNLLNARFFSVSPLIEDIVLVQGKVKSTSSGQDFLAPCYIPRHINEFFILGNLKKRHRPILVILASESYTLPEDLDWTKSSASERNYHMGLHFSTESSSDNSTKLQ